VRKVSDGVPLVTVELTDDAKDSEIGGIDVKTNGKIGVKVTEDGSRSQAMFEFLEGFLSLQTNGSVGFCEEEQR